jgi:hypothetical protein
LAIVGRLVYLVHHRELEDARSTDTIHVVDTGNPAEPVQLGQLLFLAQQGLGKSSISGFAAAGRYLHVAVREFEDRAGWVQVIDARDSANLRIAGRYGLPDGQPSPRGIAVSGNHAYLVSYANRFNVFEVSNPDSAAFVGQVEIEQLGGAIAVQKDVAYVAGLGLQVVDISIPESPRLVGRYDSPEDVVRGVAVSGNVVVYGFASADANGFPVNGIKVLDVSNPTNPRLVGSATSELLNTWDSRSRMDLSGDKLFVAAAEQGVVVFQIPSLSLRLETQPRTDADSFRLSLTGPTGQSARVQRSDDLRDWQDWRTVTLGAGPVELTDSVSEPRRFYRAVSP